MRNFLLLALLAITCFSWTSKLSAQDVINLGVNDSLGLAIRSYAGLAPDLTVVIPSGYSNPEGAGVAIKSIDLSSTLTPISTTLKKITIKGDGSKPTLKIKTFVLPASLSTALKFQDLNIIGADPVAANNYLINNASANPVPIVDTISLKGCSVSNFRGMIRLQTSGTTYKNIVINNSIISNIVDYTLINVAAGTTVDNIVISNSTVYGVSGTLLTLSAGNALSKVTISNSTFDNVVMTSTKYFIDFGTANASPVLTISNTIIGKNFGSGVKGIRGAANWTYTTTNSYTTSDWVTSGNALTGFTAYTSTAATLFKTPTTYVVGAPQSASIGDYSIIDATFAGKNNAGDPRWYSATTTDVSSPKASSIIISYNGIEISLTEAQDINIYSVTGNLLKSAKKVNVISVTDLPKGIYLVKAGSAVRKLMIN